MNKILMIAKPMILKMFKKLAENLVDETVDNVVFNEYHRRFKPEVNFTNGSDFKIKVGEVRPVRLGDNVTIYIGLLKTK